MTTQIKVEAKLFNAVRQVQSQEETRYYLNGTYVQPHPERGAVLVATDGHRMLVAHDPEGVCTKAAICAVDKEAFSRKVEKPEVADKIEIDGDGIATLGTYRSIKSVFIDGTFPDWPRVLKPVLELAKKRFYGKPEFLPASFNGRHLAHLPKVNAIMGDGTDSRAVKLISFNESDPALVLFPNFGNIFGVLVPMRAPVEPALPAFMKELMEPSPKPIAPKKPAPAPRKKLVKRQATKKPASKTKRKAA